jgi:hypothetical protein
MDVSFVSNTESVIQQQLAKELSLLDLDERLSFLMAEWPCVYLEPLTLIAETVRTIESHL